MMKRSDEINELAAALAKAQAKITAADKGKVNPHFRSKYADLASIWDACRAALTENEIAVTQMLDSADDGSVFVETMIMHSSGQYLSSHFCLPPTKQDPQGYGSAITYMRRYALAAMVGVAPDDDDGNAASGKGKAPSQQDKPPQDDAGNRAKAFAKDHITALEACESLADVDKITHEQEDRISALQTRYPKLFETLNAAWAARVKHFSTGTQEIAQ